MVIYYDNFLIDALILLLQYIHVYLRVSNIYLEFILQMKIKVQDFVAMAKTQNGVIKKLLISME